MKKILLSSLIALSVNAYADTDCTKTGIIEVRGSAKNEVMPDVALLRYKAESRNKDAKEARVQTEQNVSSFIKAVKKLGLPETSVTSSSLSLYPVYTYDKNSKKTFDGYVASRNVSISVSDFSLIGKITDLAVDSRITEVNGFSYSKKDISSVKEVTDILAIEDAKKKAITLAKGFNVKLSKPCRIRYESDADLRPLRAVSLRSSNDSSSDISIYTPEKITVSSEVYVEYSIDD